MTGTGHKPVSGIGAFDMDGTLLEGRVIYAAAREFGFTAQLEESADSTPPYLRSTEVARLLKGRSARQLAEVVRRIPLARGARSAVNQLKESGYKVGIISDSYTLATTLVARRLGLDFDIANVLEVRDDIMTGSILMPMGWEEIGCQCRQSVCKRYALRRLAQTYGVPMSATVAVGDSASDLCMIESAGAGIWFAPRGMVPPAEVEGALSVSELRAIPKLARELRQKDQDWRSGRA
jgi:phosphoserine phosphatase